MSCLVVNTGDKVINFCRLEVILDNLLIQGEEELSFVTKNSFCEFIVLLARESNSMWKHLGDLCVYSKAF